MQFSAITKGLLIAIPALVLTACGATSDSSAGKSQTTNAEAEQAQTEGMDTQTGTVDTVQVDTLEVAKTPEEIQQEKYDTLRQQQTVYFDYDTASVDGEYMELLQAHADYLTKNPAAKVMIEGHCDERGTPEYNIALGERRAKAIVQYLQSLGVSASQMTTVSYGEEKPIDLSRTDAGFSKNRRAVLVY
ncbi:MAG: peptidoglycan-associated lipoprotein [Psychrosphaera sp.]|jgi:peptidoglycan-associated lipoprotein|uniref:Peptidoglycan-associated protein n=1 Tax=Psychrosphaera aquimarina TaxID=2044854 RepID=A0ABU3R3W6_9GAMM|nr:MULTISPECIES: peptidoglycan-associated lipoprotein Pal [Psychrosphaera]MBU2917931.1 peptidoglycan-associated lipoprotein Pal [Psychrosphaera sp. F3M07]MDU0114371.1 peptidoglycan-associated lipoprotein Pal [Psychrosphaera aquimarina]